MTTSFATSTSFFISSIFSVTSISVVIGLTGAAGVIGCGGTTGYLTSSLIGASIVAADAAVSLFNFYSSKFIMFALIICSFFYAESIVTFWFVPF